MKPTFRRSGSEATTSSLFLLVRNALPISMQFYYKYVLGGIFKKNLELLQNLRISLNKDYLMFGTENNLLK